MSFSRFAGITFIVVSCFPWVGMPYMDTQPFSFISACFYLLSEIFSSKGRFAIPFYILFIIISFILGVIYSLFLAEMFDFLAIRGIVMYIGIPIFLLAYATFINKYGFPKHLFYKINCIWIGAAFLQLQFSTEIYSSFVSIRTTEDRGLTSLAPEPTFFGIYLFFSSWVMLEIENYKLSKRAMVLFVLNILSILFLAKSSMVILFCLLAVNFTFLSQMMWLGVRGALYSFFIIAIVSFLFYFLAVNYLADSRLYYIFSIILNNPFLLFEIDASSNARLSSIVLPLHSFFDNYFWPHGFYAYPSVAERVASFYDDFFFYEYDKAKIESWIGALLFELGIFGLVGLIYMIIKIMNGERNRILKSLFLLLILFSAIPTGFPLIYLLIAILIINGSGVNKTSSYSRKYRSRS
jgi:hypothetical protein